jgi:predicted RNase H-like HicB family nuclease
MHIRWSDEDGVFIATCPEFSDASAFGSTPARAAKQLQSALDLVIATYGDKGWPLPEPEKLVASSGQLRVRLPRSLHASLTTRAASEGTSLNTLIVALLSDRSGQRAVVDLVAREVSRALAPRVLGLSSMGGAGSYNWSTGTGDEGLSASIASEGSADYSAKARPQ